ncbi:XK-related protein 9-like [Branchiostoma lanceolatum]|uniref:XK-related protein 9-like n=1 Tax=Branchiostoma lanceolatum TaxID=7740 RepID=UPI00345574E0
MEEIAPLKEEDLFPCPFYDRRDLQILRLVVIPLLLYLSDIITDVLLAAQYYRSGDTVWSSWTLGLVVLSFIIMNVSSAWLNRNEAKAKSAMIRRGWCFSYLLQIGIFLEYGDLLVKLWRRQFIRVRGISVLKNMYNLPILHMMGAMLESIPQLCLQICIIAITGQKISFLKMITMALSLLSAVKAAVVLLYYTSSLMVEKLTGGLVARVVLIFIWKLIEISARALAIGLFASAFKEWVVVPIGVQWLSIMFVTFCTDEDDQGCVDVFFSGLAMALDTGTTIKTLDHKRRFWLNTVLTLVGNVAMVSVWVSQRAGKDWFDMPALMYVVLGSVMGAVIGVVEMVIRGEITCCSDDTEDYETANVITAKQDQEDENPSDLEEEDAV